MANIEVCLNNLRAVKTYILMPVLKVGLRCSNVITGAGELASPGLDPYTFQHEPRKISAEKLTGSQKLSE